MSVVTGRPMTIDIIVRFLSRRCLLQSDILCPFCLIGVKNVQSALATYNASHPEAPIIPQIKMKPYQLDPTKTDTPTTRKEAMEKKFGVEKAKSIYNMFDGRWKEMGYTP
jgi:predicted DsbA family dithiol-disulfide isomerase